MAEYSTVSIYKQDLAKLDLISFVTKKEKRDIMNLLLSELEEILKQSIENESKKGNVKLFHNLMMLRKGNSVKLAFVPALNLVSECVDMNSEEPSVDEIAEKTGVEK